MVESKSPSPLPSHLQASLDLLESVGFVDAQNPEISLADKLATGIAWCVTTAVNVTTHGSLDDKKKSQVLERIEEGLRLIGCPYPLQASGAGQVDVEGAFPVVRWLADRILEKGEDSKHEAARYGHPSEEKECPLQQLEEDLNNARASVKILNADLDELNHRKVIVLKELQPLRERTSKENTNAAVQKLISLAKSLQDLEWQESDFQSKCKAKRSELQTEIMKLEEKVARGSDSGRLLDSINHSINESLEKLNSAKRELASRLREVLALKRLVDDLPTKSELIQYERRISELYVYIQEKHRQTRKYYATYNALLERKELMLKETSLLNSISSQFQDAFTNPVGQKKLTDSMEGIMKGIQQKLVKVQLGHQEEQKVCDAFKERYAAAIAEQRRCYSLLKAFQEECTKNERLRSQNSI